MPNGLKETALFLLIAVNISAFAQVKLIEKVVNSGNESNIPYEKHKLSNGLTLLIHVDKSDPIVHVDVTYHVGSARESLGRSGFAHFFEHMMFQGSDHVADEEHFKIVTEAGGTMNGTTNQDRTNYFETLPSNQLETAFWLESDRMGFLLDAVTQQKFEIQRATVKNERGQNYDNRPYGLANEKTIEALYPFGHPYSWPTIGYIKDLDRVTVDDLKRFFLRWYGPNNAVLTVAGDVDPQQVIKLAVTYFGSIPRGPEVKPQSKVSVKLDADRYISYEDNIRFPLIQLSFPTVPSGHPDEIALDLLAELIGGDKTSILYQNLVKTNIALQASASHPASELAGTLALTALPSPGGINLAEMERLIRSGIAQFASVGVKDADLVRFKNGREADIIKGLESVSGKASKLAYYETFRGNPNYIKNELEAIRKLSKEDVMRVYKQYIVDKPSVILSVYPKGKKELAAREDNFVPRKASDTEGNEGREYKNLKYTKANDNFDRSKKPIPGVSPKIHVPEFWKDRFANNLQVIGIEDTDLPIVSMVISLPAGHAAESPEKSGIANLLASLLNESTEHYSSERMTEEVQKLGSEISIIAGEENMLINVFSLKKNLDATLNLLEEKLFHPKFDTSEFATIKAQTLAGIANNATRASTIADQVFDKLLYGEHILGIPAEGTESTVGSISLAEIKEFYAKNISASNAKLVAVGDIKQTELVSKLGFLKNWNTPAPAARAYPPKPEIEKTKIYFVNKEKAPQSEIRIGYLALPYDADGEYYRSGIMNYQLGGNFNSRINITLREKKGYTYGARTGFYGTKFIGPFSASAGVKAEKTDSSLIEFFSEMSAYRSVGISPEELSFTKNSIGQRDALKYETPFQKAAFLQRILDYNLDKDFIERQGSILKEISKNDIDGLAKRYLPLEKMIVVVVGDKASNMEQIRKLGYEVVELDTQGALVN
jgi:zinc protease